MYPLASRPRRTSDSLVSNKDNFYDRLCSLLLAETVYLFASSPRRTRDSVLFNKRRLLRSFLFYLEEVYPFASKEQHI